MTDRIKRNCSNNIINDVAYRERLIEYEVYHIQSRHSEKDIDKAFCKRAKDCKRNQANNYNIWRKTNHLLKIMKD